MTAETIALGLMLCMVPWVNLNPALYWLVADWYRTREGRAVMTGLMSLALLVDGAVLYTFVPDFPGKPIVAVTVYALILLGQVLMTYALVRLPRPRRKGRS